MPLLAMQGLLGLLARLITLEELGYNGVGVKPAGPGDDMLNKEARSVVLSFLFPPQSLSSVEPAASILSHC